LLAGIKEENKERRRRRKEYVVSIGLVVISFPCNLYSKLFVII
jgi:hypothetical protein